MQKKNIYTLPLIILSCLLLATIPGCYKEKITKPPRPQDAIKKELDFDVTNNTKNTLYITCFYYALRETGVRWEWYKSPVYKLESNKRATIDIHTIVSDAERDDVYGYLGVFEDEDKAKNSIYELLSDESKIELGILIKRDALVLQTETYGFKGEYWDWKFVKKGEEAVPELDFPVENRIEKDLWITCFVYQKKEDHPQWIFDKTSVQKIKAGQTIIIDIDTITVGYDRRNVIGYLGIFKSNQKKEADNSVFEGLKPDQKLAIGKLYKLRDNKVVIIPKRYGVITGFDDRHPDTEFLIEKH